MSLISDEKEILDVGCGHAILSVYLAKRGHCVTAIDNDAAKIKAASEIAEKFNAEVTLRLGDALRLGFDDEAFDLVICSEMLEHLDNPLAALREDFRVLRPKGKILLSVPNGKSPRVRILKMLGLARLLFTAQHKQSFDQASISKLVMQSGFKIIQLTSDFIPFPKLPPSIFLNQRKEMAKRYPFVGQHLFILGVKG